MIEEAHRLERAGANLIVIPCNTAHYFYEGLQRECKVPILNIIRETVGFLKEEGISRMGLLATEGTVGSNAYGRICDALGVECIYPTKEEQDVITSLIYEDVKQGRPADIQKLMDVASSLLARGCERLVLGCTELSLLKPALPQKELFTDSLEVLALRTILACGKTPIGPEPFQRKGASHS